MHTFQGQWDDLVNSTVLTSSIKGLLKGDTFLTYMNFTRKSFKEINPSPAIGFASLTFFIAVVTVSHWGGAWGGVKRGSTGYLAEPQGWSQGSSSH